MTPHDIARTSLARLGVPMPSAEGAIACRSPLDGSVLGYLPAAGAIDHEAAVSSAAEAFLAWREVPAPRRGEFVRLLGEELRAAKTDLAALVTLEAGKIPSEAMGEVQEMIDICDFATGLSRQLHGLTIASERPGHRMMETWHPAGITAVITAFNFPVAVWGWNAALALICGNPVIWKPSEKTPLTALAVSSVAARAAKAFGGVPQGLLSCLVGGAETGARLAADERVAVLSATGSTRMGRAVAPIVAQRFGKMILELGGNNAGIVCPSADLDLATRAIAFSALGTAGQRCTTMRRLFVHESVRGALLPRLKAAFASARVGNPSEEGVLVGPLIDGAAGDMMQDALAEARALGAVITGGERLPGAGVYVRPAIVEMSGQQGPMLRETFAPILYVVPYADLSQAIALNNEAGAGLSSSIFTTDLREAERFLSAAGSDCGIANVNIGTSGAEIGGAFGGEKETGGGRESGSDAWKGYMRRATNTINYSGALPLAQGIRFDLPD
ncbi:aldehyde dehydrogenase family protein [Hyphomonas sp. WL0036]|uniref:L-piperidine-6-carboxylate dehydrogenase n=1 Tax=Hyphomonas sediminis TaxID=2866160 RepID=UPI001C808F40|nr:aldehyde dehydrogenase family protein [Hyphomonas sediminis]MBY9066547.1 aldehyde dehydrogenase family protein [Hyphomonas sediminis]